MSKLLPAALIAAGTAAAVKYAKKKAVRPELEAKKIADAFKLNYLADEPYNNGVALTPPMGWSSWNLFRNKINEDLIYETAKALKDSGLSDCGYKYVNIDDCWHSSMRDENGRLQGDLVSFPRGIKNLVEKVNSLGLKLGIYSSNGTLTCEDLPASLGNEGIDADTFAQWGIEYFKYDFCHNVPVPKEAPDIIKISVTKCGESNGVEYRAEDAILSGNARIIKDKSIADGEYITGLSANSGACEFLNVVTEHSGEYVLTLNVRKTFSKGKHIEILVNGEDIYRTDLPATKAPSKEGCHQIKISLKSGTNTIKLFNPVASKQDSAAIQYETMGKELKRATKEFAEKNGCSEKPIVFSICEWGRNFPWRWGAGAGNLWRTTPDIMPVWRSVIGIYEFNVLLHKYAGAGHWNDPDMLEVGNGNLTFEENKTHFTLWCMMAAPLILGNDIRKFIKEDGTVDTDNITYKIISNKELIGIDQDALGIQCQRIKTNGIHDVLVKPLVNDEFAVCFLNKSNRIAEFEHSISDIVCRAFVKTPLVKEYFVRDLWSCEESIISDKIKTCVPPHGIKIFRVRVK